MTRIILENVTKRFGDHVAVDNISLEIPSGSFFSLLGPSGCGKTTLMRLIAGFEHPNAGRIIIGDRVVADAHDLSFTPPARRGLGMVFQSYALWPHMTVRDNVLFGLTTRKVPKAEHPARLAKALDIVRIGDLAERYPSELSGGQQQRVALARELIVDPGVLMLDEPLSNLDAQLRLDMRLELRRLHQETGRSFIYVTHDQIEALSLSTEIMVMRDGHAEQIGPPDTIYADPQTLFVAGFVGHGKLNQINLPRADGNAAFEQVDPGRPALLAIRPEDLVLTDQPGPMTLPAQVTARLPMGPNTVLAVSLSTGERLTLEAARQTVLPAVGADVHLHFPKDRVMIFDQATHVREVSYAHATPHPTPRSPVPADRVSIRALK